MNVDALISIVSTVVIVVGVAMVIGILIAHWPESDD